MFSIKSPVVMRMEVAHSPTFILNPVNSDISTSSELLPNDTKAVSSKPITIIPISSGGQSSMKRRQSEQKTGTSYQQHSRQPSTGSMSWKSKLGSFLKKGSNLQAESQEPKTEIKTPLRRSQSDDSMLSGQSSKLDDEKSVIKLNTNDTVNTTALRLAGSSKTPRPKGNIFLSNESLRHIDGYNVGKSDSIPTLSAHTNPSSHSPFSGLNSDFPGVMGDSGLGFNPLQYSPTFSSDSGIPDLPRTPKDQSFEDLTLVNNTSSQSNEVDEYYPRVTIGALDNIKPVKHTNGANQRTKHPQIPGGHGEALSVKGQDIPCASEKMVQGGGRIDGTSHSGNIQSNAAQPVKTAQNDSIAPVNDLSGSTSTRNCNTSNNQTVQESETAYGTPKSTADMNESFYWKSEEIDSLTEINELRPHHPDLGHAEPYHRTVPHEIQSQRNAQPVELPDISGYSVQYACNQEDFNGRTRRSIVATFVQDRPQDSRVRRPHSIRRSFDVPPTDIQQPSRRRLRVGNPYRQRSIYDITRRSQAYASWVSQHQKENFVKPADTWHGRSLSVGDELSPRERPIPAPRAMTRPAPPPRYNYGGSELGGIPFPSTTATASLGNELIFAHENHVNGRTILSPQIEHYTHNSKGLLCTLSQARPVYKSPVTVLSEQTIVARQPQPGMVSPSDNVCASTVLSWV